MFEGRGFATVEHIEESSEPQAVLAYQSPQHIGKAKLMVVLKTMKQDLIQHQQPLQEETPSSQAWDNEALRRLLGFSGPFSKIPDHKDSIFNQADEKFSYCYSHPWY